MEKVNFLSAWSLPHRLFIFGAVVIVMKKGSVTVAALPWLAQLDGGRDGRTGTELLSHAWVAWVCSQLREALASHRRKSPIPS